MGRPFTVTVTLRPADPVKWRRLWDALLAPVRPGSSDNQPPGRPKQAKK